MKFINILLVILLSCTNGFTQGLTTIEQDYQQALGLAAKDNKLLLINFYTSWCIPCKKLDKLIFQNDSIKQILGKDYILLRYNAENDTVFHLSKKHHIFIYPSAVVLNKSGYVVNRNYGFSGEDFATLSKSVLAFTNQSRELNGQNIFLKGYTNNIDISGYPKFYINFINRTNTKPDPVAMRKYFTETHNIYSEEYFSTLLYFGADEVPGNIADSILKNKKQYTDLYGEKEVESLLYVLVRSKFDKAIAQKSQQLFDDAVLYVVKIVNDSYAATIQSFKTEFLMAQNKWAEVFRINEELKNKGGLSDESVNHFCWTIYEKCTDSQVIKQCISWMKELTGRKPEYAYLDTYAFLLYKSGNKEQTKKIAQLALEAAKKEKENTKALEKMLEKLR
ncbi:MAG: thioredoxin family protein [Chitinophagaceae bacterium]